MQNILLPSKFSFGFNIWSPSPKARPPHHQDLNVSQEDVAVEPAVAGSPMSSSPFENKTLYISLRVGGQAGGNVTGEELGQELYDGHAGTDDMHKPARLVQPGVCAG